MATKRSFKSLLSSLILAAVRLQVSTSLKDKDPVSSQQDVLRRLMERAKNTDFGRKYGFTDLLQASKEAFIARFQEQVPSFSYEEMAAQWWHRVVAGEPNVCWPEKIEYIANSSGTTAASTKMIPVSPSMIRQTQLTSKAVMLELPNMGINTDVFTRQVISIGGGTKLKQEGGMKLGLFSGIVFGQTPFWLRHYFKPEPEAYNLPEWSDKVDYIVQKAPQWDIGSIYGFPCWIKPLAERIVAEHGLNSLQDIWPNLRSYMFSGMKMDPYRARLTELMGPGLVWVESYVASEGYFAIQLEPAKPGLRLLTNWSIFYEFVPFDAVNFDENGELRPGFTALTLGQVNTDQEYALLVTNNSGAWRYQIGDTIRFTSVQPFEIQFVGRTAHFLNDTGERISVGNLEMAFAATCAFFDSKLNDFAVWSEKREDHFQHTWFVEGTALPVGFSDELDRQLQVLNDNYTRIRHNHLIAPPQIHLIPPGSFHRQLKATNRDNGQSKIARVLKREQANFLMMNDER